MPQLFWTASAKHAPANHSLLSQSGMVFLMFKPVFSYFLKTFFVKFIWCSHLLSKFIMIFVSKGPFHVKTK